MEQNKNFHDGRGQPDTLSVEQVIHLSILRGKGTNYDKFRMVEQYYDMDGNLIFELDPCRPYTTAGWEE